MRNQFWALLKSTCRKRVFCVATGCHWLFVYSALLQLLLPEIRAFYMTTPHPLAQMAIVSDSILGYRRGPAYTAFYRLERSTAGKCPHGGPALLPT